MAREASKVLCERRAKIVASKKMTTSGRRRRVPDPGSTKGKQNTLVPEPRQRFQHKPSMLSYELDMDEVEVVSEDDSDDMEDWWLVFCDMEDGSTNNVESDTNKNIDRSNDEEAGSDVEVIGSPMAELDDYDIEMARAFGEEAEPASKRDWESTFTPEVYTADQSGHVDRDGKRRKLETKSKSSQLSSPVIQ